MASATATNAPLRPRIGAASGNVLVALLATLVAAGAVAVHRITGRYWGDLAVYRAGGSAAADGDGSLYQLTVRGADGIELGFTYPPFAALLFQPFAVVGPEVAIGIWTLGSMLALAAVLRLVLRGDRGAATASRNADPGRHGRRPADVRRVGASPGRPGRPVPDADRAGRPHR